MKWASVSARAFGDWPLSISCTVQKLTCKCLKSIKYKSEIRLVKKKENNFITTITLLNLFVKATTFGATVSLFSFVQPHVVSSSGWIDLKHGKSRSDSWLAISSGAIRNAEHTISSQDWLIDEAAGRLLVLYWYSGSRWRLAALSPRL